MTRRGAVPYLLEGVPGLPALVPPSPPDVARIEAPVPDAPTAPLGCERMVHADDALQCGTVAFSIFAQVSRIETVRLKTNPEGEVSGSTQK